MSKTVFHDDNFRLACIDILLDTGYFQDELSGILAIPDSEEGWEVNPERLKAFQELPITQDHLNKITSFAPDGGDDIYFHVFPMWSGEEEEFDIRSFEDLKKLRNLESISVYAMAMEGAFDLSLLLTLQKLKEVDTDHFFLALNCDFEATVAVLEEMGVEVTIRGNPRNG
ncbi:MAG: hypothetical protein KDA84_05495 [Planctomycetaceae bacterium]|nr:hypothetical protein [Planctomycetaceae bacterium]